MKNSIKSITRAVTCFARRTGENEVVRIGSKVYGFASPNGSFHSVYEPLYACLLRHASEDRRAWLTAARMVRKMDNEAGRLLP